MTDPQIAAASQQRLAELMALRPGWSGNGEGHLIAQRSRDAAEAVLAQVHVETDIMPRLYPTLEGGIQTEWEGKDTHVTVEFRPNGDVWMSTYAHADEGSSSDRLRVDQDRAIARLLVDSLRAEASAA